MVPRCFRQAWQMGVAYLGRRGPQRLPKHYASTTHEVQQQKFTTSFLLLIYRRNILPWDVFIDIYGPYHGIYILRLGQRNWGHKRLSHSCSCGTKAVVLISVEQTPLYVSSEAREVDKTTYFGLNSHEIQHLAL